MTPFIETMPQQWVLDTVAAQGLALRFIQGKGLPEELPEALNLLTKAVLFQHWMMLKSGILSLEDVEKLVLKDFFDLEVEKIDVVLLSIRAVLTNVYNILEGVYQIEKEEKQLVSDFFEPKSEIH